jgi:hypothetical protein
MNGPRHFVMDCIDIERPAATPADFQGLEMNLVAVLHIPWRDLLDRAPGITATVRLAVNDCSFQKGMAGAGRKPRARDRAAADLTRRLRCGSLRMGPVEKGGPPPGDHRALFESAYPVSPSRRDRPGLYRKGRGSVSRRHASHRARPTFQHEYQRSTTQAWLPDQPCHPFVTRGVMR